MLKNYETVASWFQRREMHTVAKSFYTKYVITLHELHVYYVSQRTVQP